MPVIAVDGPSASGKGTVARALAQHFRLPYLDTGTLYRGIGYLALQQGMPLDDGAHLPSLVGMLSPELLSCPGIRRQEVAGAASRVAAVPALRQALLSYQREFAGQQGGALLDGRDIGTVIVPDADVKLFITARPEVRARRRYLELLASNPTIGFQQVFEDIRQRDERDRNRTSAPLKPASDALLLDTSDSDIATSVQRAIQLAEEQINRVF